MNNAEKRPPVWVGHVAMYTLKVTESSEFMQKLGMRWVAGSDDFAVLEMRGGTHLVLTSDQESALIRADFDLMVEDLDTAHARYLELGLEPGEIERGKIHDSFEMREPGGTVITFNSSHVGKLPV
ncbi:MAG: glyoxalase/bleomycin resistance/dioxygenase family protein [Gammaproteobacteria bacterium]|nr:glyoxalase/bleomycin resistance/dioxygenase family protein [Gammaproteobacteria bacterium]